MSRVFVEITKNLDVTIDGVVFKLKFVPRLLWKKVETELSIAGLALRKPGKDITEESVKLIPETDIFIASEKFHEVYRRMVKFSVCGHSGIVNAEEKEIPFALDQDGFLDDSLLELYDLNGFVLKLATEVMKFNRLTEDEAKN